MELKMVQEEKDDVTILRLSGKLVGGPTAEKFQETIKALVAQGKNNVLVDMGGVSWVNSTGLGILIASYTTLRRSDGKVKLLKVSKRVQSILMITKLSTIFETHEDEAKALASFAA